jgi:hypothetical protein
MSLTKRREGHQVKSSQHSGRPQTTVKVTNHEVPDNHPKRVWPFFTSAGMSLSNSIYTSLVGGFNPSEKNESQLG